MVLRRRQRLKRPAARRWTSARPSGFSSGGLTEAGAFLLPNLDISGSGNSGCVSRYQVVCGLHGAGCASHIVRALLIGKHILRHTLPGLHLPSAFIVFCTITQYTSECEDTAMVIVLPITPCCSGGGGSESPSSCLAR